MTKEVLADYVSILETNTGGMFKYVVIFISAPQFTTYHRTYDRALMAATDKLRNEEYKIYAEELTLKLLAGNNDAN